MADSHSIHMDPGVHKKGRGDNTGTDLDPFLDLMGNSSTNDNGMLLNGTDNGVRFSMNHDGNNPSGMNDRGHTPSSFAVPNSNAAQKNQHLTQLLSKTPSGMPYPPVLGINSQQQSDSGSMGGHSNSPHQSMNARASPALQNSATMRQSPQLSRTGTPNMHPTLISAGQYNPTSSANSNGPMGMNMSSQPVYMNGPDGFQQQQMGNPRMNFQPNMPSGMSGFSNGPVSNGPMQGSQFNASSGGGIMLNGPQPQMSQIGQRPSMGNMPGQQQPQPQMVGMPRSQAPNVISGGMRMPNNMVRPNMTRLPGPNNPSMNMGNPQVAPTNRPFNPGSFQNPPSVQMNMNPVSPAPNPMQQMPPQQMSFASIPMNPAANGQGIMQNQMSPPSVGDPEKRKIIQQQLVLLLHAHKCQRRELQPTPDGQKRAECNLPHCKTMKSVLHHMTQCTDGKSCVVPHCASSRRIIQHWKTCNRADCPVCLPLKQASDRSNKPTNPNEFQLSGPLNAPMAQSGNLSQNAMGMQKMHPSNNSRIIDTMCGSGMGSPQQFSSNLSNFSQMESINDNVVSPGGGFSGPGSVGPTPTQAQTLQSLIETPSAGTPHMQFHPTSLPSKDWHSSIGMDLRNHLIQKLVQAIFPFKDPAALQDKRMTNLIAYARKVEADMYNMATTREEYYQLLAEKIYKIQKELEEKRNSRQNQKRTPNSINAMTRPQRPSAPGESFSQATISGVSSNMPRQGFPTLINQNMAQSSPFPVVSSPLDTSNQYGAQNGYAPYGFPPSSVNSMYDPSYVPKSESMQQIYRSPLSSGMSSMEPSSQPMSMDESMNRNVESAESIDSSPRQRVPNDFTNTTPERNSSRASGVVKEENAAHSYPSPPQQPAGPSNDTAGDSENVKTEGDADAAMLNANTDSSKGASSVKHDKIPKKIHDPDELRENLLPLLDRLYRHEPEALPFREPVDPQLLGIPDYFEIVKAPMDLSTIRRKVENKQYEDPWQFIDDIWLMFNNAWIYNRKGSKVYKYCSKLAEAFEADVDPAMINMGYCCGRRYVFQPQILCCYGKQLCTIPRDHLYMSYQNRYTYCLKCFNDISGDTVTLGDEPGMPTTNLPKSEFVQMKNDQVDYEPFVNCKSCGRKNHQICVLHMDQIWPHGFVCNICLKEKGDIKRKENRFTAKKLPQTKLGTHIENHVNSFLQSRHIVEAGEVTIRVLSSCDKVVEVKPGMKHKFVDTGDLSENFPYRTKAIFAFEEIDGTDVCFFGMHVQEYGSECPAPNSRRIYIAYLDSVHFFRPKYARTAVYHEILLSYINYCKNLGYTMAHIWACPPSEGDDYVFHCHPPEQKIPKPKRLQEWYRKMLDKGISDQIIVDHKDIMKHAMDDSVTSATEMPYFEGDFWPNVMEECIKELEQLEMHEKEQRQSLEDSDDSDDTGSEHGKGKKRTKKNQDRKKGSKKQNSRKISKKGLGGIGANVGTLTQKIFKTMDKHKDVFFVVRLHTPQRAAQLPPIVDPDPLISCELMDGRDAFLTMARDRHYEFSSLRRTKFSTMAMLYELHNQGQDRFVYTCNNCKSHVETRYHCTVCDDFDLCCSCYEKDGHPHKMDKLGFDLDDGGSSKDSKTTANPQESRALWVQRCCQSLIHASQCRDANCRQASCMKMKRVVTHTKVCKKKANGGCPICKQLIALCCYHAKQCNDQKCLVPFCMNIKVKLRQQRTQQEIARQQFNRRRAAIMNASRLPGGLQAMQASQNASVPSPLSGNISPHAPGVGNKSIQRPNIPAANEAVQQALGHAHYQASKGKGPVISSYQQNPPHQYGGKPISLSGMGQGMISPTQVNQAANFMPQNQGLMTSNQGSPPMARSLPPVNQSWPVNSMSSGKPGGGPMGNIRPVGPPGVMQNVVQQQQQQQQQQQPQLQNAGSLRAPVNAYQQLLEVLKSPPSADQQHQVSTILRGNPQLMAAFLKHTRGANGQNNPDPNMILRMNPASFNQPQLGSQQQQQQQAQMQQPQGMPGGGQMQLNRPSPPQQQPQGNLQRPPMYSQMNSQPQQGGQMQAGLQQQYQQQMVQQRMQQIPQNNYQQGQQGQMTMTFNPGGQNQARMRFSQAQPGQQQQFQSSMGMGPPSSFAHPQQMQQSQQGQPGDMNVYSVGLNSMVSQQQQQTQQIRIPMGSSMGPNGQLQGSNPIRSPASALPVRSPQAQPSPNMGRQSTPGPGLSPSPRPLSSSSLHPSGSVGYDMNSGSDMLMQSAGQNSTMGHHLMQQNLPSASILPHSQMSGAGPGGGQMEMQGHGMNMGMMNMGMGMGGHFHHQPSPMTPQDQLNKFVENL